ncbi:DUF2125 domain-containing protein [Sneathiella chinensis]|uniref:DUF2125 domain-containing protein n=1 Tax=Sneathiella chinensis TaxID=349750 RepID=A0ABQ5U0Q8_9PROT|nr:DUF2125 domain-containing protein [Sneathiella chinensis]GLQ05308.1 hypothetical protein GCM10007924_05290 [Sneathiella chinensis]
MRILGTGVIALAALSGGYYYWWNTVADTGVEEFHRWKTARQAEGFDINHGPVTTSGFPYRIRMDIANFQMADPQADNAPEVRFETAWAIAQPWKLTHVIFGVGGENQVNWSQNHTDYSTLWSAETALGSATFETSGRLKTLSIDLKTVEARPSWRGPLTAERLQLHTRPIVREITTSDDKHPEVPGTQISLRGDTIVPGLKEDIPLAETLEHFGLSAVMEGEPADLFDRDSAAKWRDKGGILDIQALETRWGDVKVDATGTLALDDEFRMIGAFTSRIVGINSILGTLHQNGRLDEQAAKTAGYALNLMTRKDKKNGDRYLELPISLQEGSLYVGPLFLMRIPPLYP